MQPRVENMMMRLIGSDFRFRAVLRVARDQVIKVVLAMHSGCWPTQTRMSSARVLVQFSLCCAM